ncbi:MAG: NAD(P)/FAD-dependent oxidoreductase [Spirochaetaceae bacterium]
MAIVGAGISGLAAARRLVAAGMAVTVFERGRGPGGRAARRRVPGFEFDHGAQYFTARSRAFADQTEAWVEAGVAAVWSPRMATAGDGKLRPKNSRTTRYVGVPGMSALTRSLAEGLDLRTRTGVASAAPQRDAGDPNGAAQWELEVSTGDGGAGKQKVGPFDALLLACTPRQGLPLLDAAPGFAARAQEVTFDPVWAVLLGFDHPPELAADAVFIEHPALSWAARNDSKPGRSGGPAWVLHATGSWSRGREEDAPESVVAELLPAFEEAVGLRLPEPVYAAAHRWRYARSRTALTEKSLWDADLNVGMCGDWCSGARIEGAFESGLAAARRLLDPGAGSVAG